MSARPIRDVAEDEAHAPDVERAPRRARLAARLRADWIAARGPSEFGADWDEPDAELRFRESHPLGPELDALAPGEASGIMALGRALGLSPAEFDLVDLIFAATIDPGLGQLFSALGREGRAAVTAPLCARLFGHGRTLLLTESSALRAWGLVVERELTPDEPPGLTLDPAILARLCGRDDLEPALAAVLRHDKSRQPLAGWPVEATARVIAANLSGVASRPVRVFVRGQPGDGRTTFARCVAAELGLPLLAFDIEETPDEAWGALHRLANRRAFLDDSAIAWRDRRIDTRPWPGRRPSFPLEFLILDETRPAPRRGDGAAEIEIALPSPDREQRRALWLAHWPPAASWLAGDLDRVAMFEASPAEIAGVARREPQDAEACIAALGVNLPPELRDFAELPDCTFRWSDLVAAAPVLAALEDFAFEARARGAIWGEAEAQRLFPQGRALVGLFSGPPGTGKTMAAQVLAAELGLTLCRVNLATITSKWVGETSQRADLLFRFCRGRNTLLLIDEADALCSKRIEEGADAQDAHVNRDISHLMMAIENHDGVVVLTTNLKGNIDPAFLRRIRHSVEFRLPTAAERRTLWAKLIDGLAGGERAAALGSRIGPLAEIEASGAQIKNAVLSARFAALRERTQLSPEHLASGLDREFRKEGYGLSARQIAEASGG